MSLMAPAPPSVCGVARCCGSASRSAYTLKCDMAVHHRAFLVKDKSGCVSWAWSTRGEKQLTDKGMTVLKADPDEPAAAVADEQPRAPVVGDAAQEARQKHKASDGSVPKTIVCG